MAQARWLLVVQALWELLRYDVIFRIWGFRRIHAGLRRMAARQRLGHPSMETEIREAMKWAFSLYWKPALCLQRSVAMARLYRRHGLDAEVVIGYRAQPFLSHAWVEINGRIVNDSVVYQQRLCALERI